MLIVFVAPYFTENARLFLGKLGQVDGIRLALVSQEPVSMLSPELKNRVAFDYRVDDALDFGQILTATRHIVPQAGPVHRLLGAVEQLQVPLAEVRRELAIAGMTPEVARGFRDKTEMKRRLAEAGVPVARFAEVTTAAGARAFARKATHSSQVTLSTGVRGSLWALGLSGISAAHCACVTSCRPT